MVSTAVSQMKLPLTTGNDLDPNSEVFQRALEQVKTLLQTEEDLHNLEEKKKAQLARKANVDTRLRTAIKSQLDGIKTGLTQLDAAVKDMQKVRAHINDVNSAYKHLNTMNVMLPNLVDTAAEHSQLLAAKENFAYIVQVPEKVANISEFIEQGKLIYAHSYLAGLENCRDDLLVELYRQSKSSHSYEHNVETIRQFFGDVEKLFFKLHRKIMDENLPRFLELANTNPAELTNIARIIWREEAKNKLCREVKEKEGIDNPDRLNGNREWRDDCLKRFDEIISERIEKYFSELMKFLERGEFYGKTDVFGIEVHKIKLQVVQDLKTIKFHVVKCFPPDFAKEVWNFPNLYDFFLNLVHRKMKEWTFKVCHEVSEPRMNEQERFAQKTLILQMLYFVKFQYTGAEFLGVPELEIDVTRYTDILDQGEIDTMETQFQEITEESLQKYSENCLETEVRSWWNPKVDNNGIIEMPKIVGGLRYTQLHIDLFQAINSTFESVAFDKKIPASITYNVGISALYFYMSFGDNYEDQLRRFYEDWRQTKEFADSQKTAYFLAVMVANMNCCSSIVENNIEKLSKKFFTSGDWMEDQVERITKKTQQVKRRFLEIAIVCAQEFVYGNFAFWTKESYLDNLLNRDVWLVDGDEPLYESISMTVTDFIENDLNSLQSKYTEVFINKCQTEVAVAYLKKLMVKRTFGGALSAANVEDRQKIAYKLKKEADALHKYFIDKLETLKGCAISHSEGPLQAVVSVADMYLTSKDMMIVILGALCKNYPDATPTQLERLIGFHEEFRGDAGRNGVKSAFASVPPPKKGEISRATVFSHAELKA